jgi:hypothetical protein
MHIHIYSHTYICTHIYIHIHIYAHTYICTYIYMHIHIYAHTYICTYIYIHIHIYAHTYICTYIYMHIHIYAHTYGCRFQTSVQSVPLCTAFGETQMHKHAFCLKRTGEKWPQREAANSPLVRTLRMCGAMPTLLWTRLQARCLVLHKPEIQFCLAFGIWEEYEASGRLAGRRNVRLVEG